MLGIEIPLESLDSGRLALRLGMAILLGAAVGMNRNLHGKPAGLKTHALVSLGAAIAALIGLGLDPVPTTGEFNAMSRVIQGVLQGIGFIGAGVILHNSAGSKVHGLTTAASVWISAVLGLACGAGAWKATSIAFAMTLLVLVFGASLERRLHRMLGGDDSHQEDDGQAH